MGIASVADINRYAPPGHRPDDFLPGARSVIVFAGRPTTRGAWSSPDHLTLIANKDFFNIRSGISLATAKLIEDCYGYYSLADVPPPTGLNASMSFKLCAEMAGLGTRSMAGGIILNRELGLIDLFTCVTTMSLKADGPLQEPVCPASSCVKMWEKKRATPCLEACPECLSGELEDGRIKWIRYNRISCSTKAENFNESGFQKLLLECINQSAPEVRRTMLLGSYARHTLGAVASGSSFGHCFECLRNCPICVQGRSLKGQKNKIGRISSEEE